MHSYPVGLEYQRFCPYGLFLSNANSEDPDEIPHLWHFKLSAPIAKIPV